MVSPFSPHSQKLVNSGLGVMLLVLLQRLGSWPFARIMVCLVWDDGLLLRGQGTWNKKKAMFATKRSYRRRRRCNLDAFREEGGCYVMLVREGLGDGHLKAFLPPIKYERDPRVLFAQMANGSTDTAVSRFNDAEKAKTIIVSNNNKCNCALEDLEKNLSLKRGNRTRKSTLATYSARKDSLCS
jgi:hypothetical protein